MLSIVSHSWEYGTATEALLELGLYMYLPHPWASTNSQIQRRQMYPSTATIPFPLQEPYLLTLLSLLLPNSTSYRTLFFE